MRGDSDSIDFLILILPGIDVLESLPTELMLLFALFKLLAFHYFFSEALSCIINSEFYMGYVYLCLSFYERWIALS